jgi:hypothetical protein
LTVDELGALLGKARAWPAWRAREERGEPLELVFSPESVFDVARPDGRDGMRALLARHRQIGTTALNLRFRSTSLAHLLEQLEVFARDVAPEFA